MPCMDWNVSGSSPLARGTLHWHYCRRRRFGLIPAHAGNTLTRACSRCSRWAHPRSRGEHGKAVAAMGAMLGSSPLARGTLNPQVRDTHQQGLIPARAGNMYCSGFSSSPSTAHPRSHGEHKTDTSHPLRPSGSSPLTRGTQLSLDQHCLHVGLIPARAGNTGVEDLDKTRHWAHPRSRGEHLQPQQSSRPLRGSSPLARGTQFRCSSLVIFLRLIPARAGNMKLK